MALTAQQLAAACDCPLTTAQKWLGPLAEAMARYRINTPQRQAAFLAQVAHESMRLSRTRELWGPTKAQQGYEGRRDLGNVQPGDGSRYRGRGLIQITGRANYREAAEEFGIDAVGNPALLEQPAYAALTAAWFWESRSLNALADRGQFDAITKRINGGSNGADDRRKLWAGAKRALGLSA